MSDPTDSCDFPAAHSMDTTWFAVDRDGNVAMFETGESGAVPSSVADEYYPGEEVLEELGERLYRYEHTTENWISGPYERQNVPASPVKESAMPADVLEHAVRFDGSFAEVEKLQPAEFWACESWQPGWLALDGKTVRPFEGREDEFEDAEENLEGEGDLEVKPPLTGLPEATPVKTPEPGSEARRDREKAWVFTGSDVAPTSSEADWSDVMPKSEDLEPKGKPEQAADAVDPPKKPWWKLW
ncbi:MAG: hypothetical protein JST00_35230 [Deltaproteobacteria bacterium]|nr:hypothetical protein [Deltaproteobacteria bacterium]